MKKKKEVVRKKVIKMWMKIGVNDTEPSQFAPTYLTKEIAESHLTSTGLEKVIPVTITYSY